jgi:hypothetical protein
VDAAGQTSFAVSSRNAPALFGFQLGVRTSTNGGRATYEFAGDLGTDRDRLVELIFTNDRGESLTPQTPNRLVADTASVAAIERGQALTPFAGGDFLSFDLNPGVGGPGFFLGYVSDLDSNVNRIPPTAPGPDCPVNELLVVRLGGVERPFFRSDADGNGRINVSDAVLIIQGILGNLPKRFRCDDLFDGDDNGRLAVIDALPLLKWVFEVGPPVPAPFLVCAGDPTADELTCQESNCAGGR